MAQCYGSSQGEAVMWKLNVYSIETKVKLAYGEKSICTQSLIGPFVCKWRLQIYISPYSTALIGQNGMLWLVSEEQMLYSCTAPIRQGKSQSYWLNLNPRSSLIKINWDSRSPVQRHGRPVHGFPLKCRVHQTSVNNGCLTQEKILFGRYILSWVNRRNNLIAIIF